MCSISQRVVNFGNCIWGYVSEHVCTIARGYSRVMDQSDRSILSKYVLLCTYVLRNNYCRTNLLASKANSDGIYGGAEEDNGYGGPEPHFIGKHIHHPLMFFGMDVKVSIAPDCKRNSTFME